ncbi:MAG: D-alanyl-D-alanine carboxypeptidase/D-alanyl-D-alanine-endopeptidase [Myxococcales bacterium]|jgi:D-alanyl-D-alanine carboxypeptidase/D-alanyl-D-alanine-endopeptidase (penicillin-binding protein 4)|nr:D-alanyl-D-alanine carboxypeptidase/D-alanyl-D-alanine-endopeptidase [Myxococcales bacterium]
MSLVPVYRHKAGKWKDLRSTSSARLCIGLLAGLLGGHAASASPQRVGDGPQPVTSGLAHASATVSDRHATAAFGSGPVFAQAATAPSLATSASPTTTAPALAPASPTPASGTTPNGQPIPTEQEKSSGGPALPPLTAPPTDVGLRKKWLEQRVDLLLNVLLPGRNRIGIAVLDLDSGQLLYGKNADLQINIASNVKLFTTAAALTLLGPEYRYKTVLYGDRDKTDKPGEWKNLYLRGYGDPWLSTEDLWKLTNELTVRGVKRVKGDIVIDDTFFDEQRVGPAFEQKNQDSAYRAPQGAVSLNNNAITVRVLPALVEGQPARVIVDPGSAYIALTNEARTVGNGRTSLIVEASEEKDAVPGRERTMVRVRGTIRTSESSGIDFHKRVAHPDLYAGATLIDLLSKRGIQVVGKVSRGTAPPTAQLLDTHHSQPLGVLVRDINKRSNNFTAEQVLKTLGADSSGKPGSWQKGIQAVSRYLETLGILPGRYQMVNGSGLFDSNRFSATQVVTLLRAAYRDFRIAADFVASLAVAGADGTIAHRLGGTPADRYVRAKTGTLNGISCLSGYAGTPLSSQQPIRPPLAFSILVNDVDEAGGTGTAKRLQDAIVETLVAFHGTPMTPAK